MASFKKYKGAHLKPKGSARKRGARQQGGPTNPDTWNHMHIVNEEVPFTTFPINWGASLGAQAGTQTGNPIRTL